jgi:A/G-specific adenine glycosylase
LDAPAIRKTLARWYDRNRRDLPWRNTSDPYRIWVSEIMLQQTRVAAVIPYYERFLNRFPDAAALAGASEDEVLALWSGLGYYSRARNLQKAAREVAASGGFPRDYAAIRRLPGIGDYTAAAVASIAFGLPFAVVDGNVRRVVSRLTNSNTVDVQGVAQEMLDPRNPGRSNQSLMELGAVICLPRDPGCAGCPLNSCCEANRRGTQARVPAPKVRPVIDRRHRTLLVIRKRRRILLIPSPRVRGFWDLPEPFPGVRLGGILGSFRHSITTSQYLIEVRAAGVAAVPGQSLWWDEKKLDEIPLSTTAKKALAVFEKNRGVADR